MFCKEHEPFLKIERTNREAKGLILMATFIGKPIWRLFLLSLCRQKVLSILTCAKCIHYYMHVFLHYIRFVLLYFFYFYFTDFVIV